jgi:hypothetical protein
VRDSREEAEGEDGCCWSEATVAKPLEARYEPGRNECGRLKRDCCVLAGNEAAVLLAANIMRCVVVIAAAAAAESRASRVSSSSMAPATFWGRPTSLTSQRADWLMSVSWRYTGDRSHITRCISRYHYIPH